MSVVAKMTLRGVWENRRRMFGTLLAVLLGVSFLAGTMSLSDTLGSAVDSAFTTAYSTTDVVVQTAAQWAPGPNQARGQFDGSVLAKVDAVSGVAAAEPVLEGTGVIIGGNGKPVTGSGLREAGTWIADTTLNPWHLIAGSAPQGTGQVVIDQAAASAAGLSVGQSVTIQLPQPVRVTVSGIADFGTQASAGEGTYAAFSLAGAQKYIAGGKDSLTSVVVRAQPGVSQQTLADRVGAVLPTGLESITGATLIAQAESQVESDFLSYFQLFLGVFAGIALLVAALTIHNTFSISAAQRARQAALLRAVGATRGQITAGLLLEAAVLGLVGSALGLGAGIGITVGLKGVFSRLGASLPTGGLVLTAGTIALSLAVGLAITLLAAASPAVRAGRVAPVEALRESDADQTATSRLRPLIGLVLTAGGLVLAVASAPAGNLTLTGAGAVAAIVGTLALGPKIAAFAARVAGGPVLGARATTGKLAQRNVARNPKRTAGAATALTVGIAVVALFTVFAASLKAGITQSVDGAFTGQIVVNDTGGGKGFSPQAATVAAGVPGVAAAVGVGSGDVLINGVSSRVKVADPAQLSSVVDLGVTSGSMTGADFAASATVATANGWKVGQQVPVSFSDGSSSTLTLGAVYTAGNPMGDYLLSSTVWAAHNPQVFDQDVYVSLASGADQHSVISALSAAEAEYSGVSVQTKSQYVASQAATVNTYLGIVYLMLALAILIALLGIANTLSLAVYERTREIGLIRAVGATREQVRSMIRWEAVITTLIGTMTGLVLGCFLGWTLVTAGASGSAKLGVFTVPVVRLVLILLVCAGAGVLAGVRPARRAARLDVLGAIAAP